MRATWRAAAFKYALLVHRHVHAKTDACKHIVQEREKAREREGKKRKYQELSPSITPPS